MLVQDIHLGAGQQITKLNSLLNQLFGLTIDFNSTDEHLKQVYEHYDDLRKSIIREGLLGLQQHPGYAKAVLITEAVRIYLREIAPKRTKKRKG